MPPFSRGGQRRGLIGRFIDAWVPIAIFLAWLAATVAVPTVLSRAGRPGIALVFFLFSGSIGMAAMTMERK